MNIVYLTRNLRILRSMLEKEFSSETAASGYNDSIPSAGHCAVVAVIVHNIFGGQMISTRINNKSHWFNQFKIDGQLTDVDLTGDQFGFPPIQISIVNRLYANTKIRYSSEVTTETFNRVRILSKRAKLS